MHFYRTHALEGDGGQFVVDLPLLAAWKSVHPLRADRFPVADNGLRRWQGGKRKYKSFRRVRRAAIQLGYSHILKPYTLTLGWVFAINDLEAFALAPKLVRKVFGAAPATWKLEWGFQVGFHIHGSAPQDVLEALPGQLEALGFVVMVWHGDFDPEKGGALGWCKYTSKPPDPYATCHNWARQPVDIEAASESHLAMKWAHFEQTGKRRPPPCSGVINAPQPRQSKRQSWLLLHLAKLDSLIRQLEDAEEVAKQRQQARMEFFKQVQQRRLQQALRRIQYVVKANPFALPYISPVDHYSAKTSKPKATGPP